MLATLTIHLHLPACASLKEKRGRIKPLMARLRREFNVSVAEMDLQDKWTEAECFNAMALVETSTGRVEQAIEAAVKEAGNARLAEAGLSVDGETPVFEFGFLTDEGGMEISVDAVTGKQGTAHGLAKIFNGINFG